MLHKDSKNNHKFPEEENAGHISIHGNKIICKGVDSFRNCEISIKDMQYAYVIVNAKEQSSLFIFDHHQNWLPTNYVGFSNVYKELSSRFDFNDNIFFENIKKSTPLKKQVWRKKYDATYEILNENYNDYELGFEIQSPKGEFISWDDTYENLSKKDNVYFEESPYKQKILKFKYPVRIGNILLKEFGSYFDNGRTDVPVLHFFTHCIDKSNSDKSYFELKERLQKDFLKENHFLGYERKDQNSFSFKANGMLISLVYTYDNDWQFDGGYTSFSIKNQREYPELLIDLEYEKEIEVSNYITIPKKIWTTSDYKRNENIKRRPMNLLPGNNDTPVIWIDNKNSKIGFADKTHCQVFNKPEIVSFTIQNVLPARGSGGSYLELNFKDEKQNYVVFSGACHAFDTYKDKISELTGLEIKMAPEYHDC